MTIEIKAEKREKVGKVDSLRAAGFLPGVFYGHKKTSTPIQVKKVDFLKAWREAGESTVISLKTKEGSVEALIHDVDIDPVTNEPRHADFYVFEKGHKVEISVPIEFEGVAPAIKDLGGILVKVLRELKIKAEPANLPHEIKVDISGLVDFQSQILAKDVVLPKGVELIENPEEVVAAVTEAKEEVIESAPVDLSQIEVEKKGKKEEEGAAEESA
jgi:large subunit ribosomal protein L25